MRKMLKRIKRRVAVVLTATLCIVMCPYTGDEVQAVAASSESAEVSISKWTPGEYWWQEEVVAELDGNNMDENGYTYKLKTEDSSYTATLTVIKVTQYQKAKEDIVIRVPDVVIKDGEEYTVTGFFPEPDELNIKIRKKFRIYLGKSVSYITHDRFDYKMAYDVHWRNPNYKVEDGHLFSKDGSRLLRFNDDAYGVDKVYVLPDAVRELDTLAFSGAEVKEVILNEQITRLPCYVFFGSSLQKIDLKNVDKINDYAFYSCKSLQEVKINREGVKISQRAFGGSGIRNVYIPSDAEIYSYNVFENCTSLETVIFDDGVRIGGSGYSATIDVFNGCSRLKTVILPESLEKITYAMFHSCCSLRKLYIPESVQSVEEFGFRTCGKLTLYGKDESPAAQYDDDNVTFVSLSGHEHALKEITYFEYDSWGVRGRYCEECSYGCDFELVEYDEENKKEQMPEHLSVPEECPDVLELDENDRDEQGLLYELDEDSKTAAVRTIDWTNPFPRIYFILPETVKKNGKTYTLTTIEEYALNGADIVIISDSVKEIKKGAMPNIYHKIVLGENVCEIDSYAFEGSRANIEIRGDNPNFKMIGNVLYSADGTELIKYCESGYASQKEFRVPTKVTHIWNSAFYGSTLEKISIYNCGTIAVDERIIDNYSDTEIVYANGYTWYEEEDYVVEVNSQNVDENGWKYSLHGAALTADLDEIDLSIYNKSSRDITVRIPDKVIRDGRTYTVECISPSCWLDDTKKCIRLYIGKYVKNVLLGQVSIKTASYVHAENDNFVSEKGSLIYTDSHSTFSYPSLVRYFDENSNSSYKVPDQVKTIEDGAFWKANIKKLDLNAVKSLRGPINCPKLEELIIREEIYMHANLLFDSPKLKYLYLPKGSVLGRHALTDCGSLEIVVMGEDITFYKETGGWKTRGIFADNENLKTVILPEDASMIPDYAFSSCHSLDKLYIPSSVSEIGEDCFYDMSGNIYAEEGGVVEKAIGETAKFVSLKNHTHHMEQITYFSYDTWAVTGSYCRECAYGTDTERVELTGEEDKENLPPLLWAENEGGGSKETQTPILTSTPTPGSVTEEPGVTPESPLPETLEPAEHTVQNKKSQTTTAADSYDIKRFKQSLLVKGFKVSTKDNQSATLRWKVNSAAVCYRIYRSEKKNGDYKIMGTVSGTRSFYVDKSLKPQQKYYYKVTALGISEGQMIEGKYTSARSVSVSGIAAPQISVKKGKQGNLRYITVIFQKYQGEYADIHVSLAGKKYKKLKLVSNKISKYKGKFKIQYVVKGTTIRFKVRTYQKKGKNKRYSSYSKVVKVGV